MIEDSYLSFVNILSSIPLHIIQTSEATKFWDSNIFVILSGVSLIIIVILLYYSRIARLQKEKHLQQKLSQKLIENQELERQRIAQELHDGLGQNILIMKTNAQLALRNNKNMQGVEEYLNEIISIADDTLQLTREIAYNLRPLHLDRLGITETLKTLMENISKVTATVFDYDIDLIDDCISKDVEINVYRIVQESINNILKHAGASVASVKVRKTDTNIVITIQDNGIGFDVPSTMNKRGLGLIGIEERAHILNAKPSFYSEIGKGTRISLAIPLTQTLVKP